jgi:hypothetical protein
MNGPRRSRAGRGTWLSLLGFLLAAGCASSRPLPPVDLQAPGWTVQETAAVWKPRQEAPELLGELLVAHHPDGSRFVQFSKQGLPVVTAQLTPNFWQISSSLRKGRYGGRRPAPGQILWFRLESLPPDSPWPTPWQLTRDPSGSWTLLQTRTGERLEGAAN